MPNAIINSSKDDATSGKNLAESRQNPDGKLLALIPSDSKIYQRKLMRA
ncbi:hypothetical protein BLL52_3789 [Rhodoferax antarcticus ANT.BR]|uniref:Uncharacterized protein n=1 Tax=Rhodoferax antarcticus ANT.BR TaxID=1111071 RepID=A0A1Q8YAN3_9BURK|nr:hypothetical protein BLL52_3789 [Rhodoferax antarcticus ANT.BR]